MAVNARCLVRTQDGHRVVLVGGIVLCQYAVGDRMAEAHAMVSLVEQGWAEQSEVATAFGCASRTVRRLQRRFEVGGLAALGRAAGYPAGRPRLPRSRSSIVSRLKAHGHSNREIARRLGVNEKAVRKVVARLGWPAARSEQAHLPLPESTADPNLSAGRVSSAVSAVEPVTPSAAVADPNLSAAGSDDDCPTSFDTDPADRSLDRLLARLGLLDDAAPLFRDGGRVPRAGVLLAVPALMRSGVFDVARRVYGSIGPAFYGLRTTVVALLLMALLRIKRPEGLKEHSPVDLGRLLGLDRAPEVKTLRRKLARLARSGGATLFGRLLAERRVATLGDALGFLYVDGHVRVYHGQRDIPKAHVARMRIALPATTDYWVERRPGRAALRRHRRGERRHGQDAPDAARGDSRARRRAPRHRRLRPRRLEPEALRAISSPRGFDILTYRKGRFRRLPQRCFEKHSAVLDGKSVAYQLADQGIRLLGGKLREEFALDALIDHGVVPDHSRGAQPQVDRDRRQAPRRP